MAQRYESVDLVEEEIVRYFALAAVLAALTAALAQVSIQLPGSLPPFSLQPFGAFFAGLLLGPLWGGLSLSLYVLAGIVGAPVFSNASAGLGYVLVGQGTGGFLIGFLFAAVVVGAIAHRRVEPRPIAAVSIPTQAAAVVAGLVVVYVVGVPWMAWVLELPIGRAAAIMAPYLPLDLLKGAVALAIVYSGALTLE